jgi:hypothetical protein
MFIPTFFCFKNKEDQGRVRTSFATKITSKLGEILTGSMLGDGCLRFTRKGPDGKAHPNSNALFAITLKNQEYVNHY